MYTRQAEDSRRAANAALNISFARHGLKRGRAECDVCCGPANTAAMPCACGGVYCALCFKKAYADKVCDVITCLSCHARLSIAAVDAFTRPRFATTVLSRAFVAEAMANDASFVPSTQLLLPEVHEAMRWITNTYAAQRTAFLQEVRGIARGAAQRLEKSLDALLTGADAHPAEPLADPLYKAAAKRWDAVVVTALRVQSKAVTAKPPAVLPKIPGVGLCFPCPRAGCKCLLVGTSTECPGCTARVCLACEEEEVAGAPHACSPDAVASVREIRRSTRPCPDCGASIFRISGCAQMFCTACKFCVFDFKTGMRVPAGSALHNPHMWTSLTVAERARVADHVNEGLTGPEPDDLTTLPLTSAWWNTKLTRGRRRWKPSVDALTARAAEIATHIASVEQKLAPLADLERRTRASRLFMLAGVRVVREDHILYLPQTQGEISVSVPIFSVEAADMSAAHKHAVAAAFAEKRELEASLAYWVQSGRLYRQHMIDALGRDGPPGKPPKADRNDYTDTVQVAKAILKRR